MVAAAASSATAKRHRVMACSSVNANIGQIDCEDNRMRFRGKEQLDGVAALFWRTPAVRPGASSTPGLTAGVRQNKAPMALASSRRPPPSTLHHPPPVPPIPSHPP